MNTTSTPAHASTSLPPPIGQAGSTSGAGVNFCYYCREEFGGKRGLAGDKCMDKMRRKFGHPFAEPMCLLCVQGMHHGQLHPALTSSFLAVDKDLDRTLQGLLHNTIDPLTCVNFITKTVADGRAEIARIDKEIQRRIQEIQDFTDQRNRVFRKVFDVEDYFRIREDRTYTERRKAANIAISKELYRMEVFARDKNRCVYCNTRKDLTIDHVVAVNRGGSNDITNLQTLCRSCNSRKGDRPWGKFSTLDGKTNKEAAEERKATTEKYTESVPKLRARRLFQKMKKVVAAVDSPTGEAAKVEQKETGAA